MKQIEAIKRNLNDATKELKRLRNSRPSSYMEITFKAQGIEYYKKEIEECKRCLQLATSK